MLRKMSIACFVASVAAFLIVPVGIAAKPGNSPSAKLCQKGGWESLVRAEDETAFASEAECVSHGAQGGSYAAAAVSPAQRLCESYGGSFTGDGLGGTEYVFRCYGWPVADVFDFNQKVAALTSACFELAAAASASYEVIAVAESLVADLRCLRTASP
jgi:hypothetical protein